MVKASQERSDYLLEKAKHYCAIQERAASEVRKKLFEWKVRPDKINAILETLFKENYINELRFAKVFVSGKFRIKKWGRIKIKSELRARKISDHNIQLALQEIDEDEYLETLQDVINKKRSTLPEPLSYNNKAKVLNFAASKGYEKQLILELL